VQIQPDLEKPAEMGRELDPNNPLYAGGYVAQDQSLDVVKEVPAAVVAILAAVVAAEAMFSR